MQAIFRQAGAAAAIDRGGSSLSAERRGDAAGTLAAPNAGFSATERQSFPVPQAGVEGRLFELPRRNFGEIDGELKGMPLGGYGHFLQFAILGGVSLGRHLTFQGGYMLANADVHRQDSTRGFHPTFQGPVVGIQIRDR